MQAGDTIRMPRTSYPPPTIASAGSGVTDVVHIGDDAFVTDAQLGRWLRTGAATRTGTLLATSDGRRYLLRDGLRIVGRRNGELDPYGLTGSVDTLRGFLHRGATISPHTVRLAKALYDVEHGFLAVPYDGSARSAPRLKRLRAAGL